MVELLKSVNVYPRSRAAGEPAASSINPRELNCERINCERSNSREYQSSRIRLCRRVSFIARAATNPTAAKAEAYT